MVKKQQTKNGKKIRSVQEYLDVLKLAGRSQNTLKNYKSVLYMYAKFLDVPLEQVHNHLSVENLMRYAASRAGKSQNGRKSTLAILHKYMALNGVEFDELEFNVTKVTATEDRDDKPLELATLQKMMDMGNPHSRALLAFMTSTGCRAGETSKILLSDIYRWDGTKYVKDVYGDMVNIRNEIAKRKKGGKVFLTSEAREFLNIWLKDRDRYIADADKQTAKLLITPTGHNKVLRKGIGFTPTRPSKDERLFACSYSTVDKIFGRLYRAVDGEMGKYRAKVTAHSCRAFFRTHAAETMPIDLVEGILRHTGYLNSAYVRWTDGEKRKQFHAGEAALYITRADHRIQTSQLDILKRENAELQERLNQVEQTQPLLIEEVRRYVETMRSAKDDPDSLIDYANYLKKQKEAE